MGALRATCFRERRLKTCAWAAPKPTTRSSGGRWNAPGWPTSCGGNRGWEPHLGPQGANLSGGRRQRLALARALLHGTPIYIFDEATSNSDVGRENDIIAEIHALAGEKTVLLVSHRPANVAAADCICVPGPGRGPPPFWPECQVRERVA